MALSEAKKKRLKMVREGKRNPEEKRGVFVFADLRTRRTKTKKETLLHQDNKHKKRLEDYLDI